MSNAPAKKFRIGYLTASIWKNEGNGKPFYTIDLARTYREGEELKNTGSLNHADLLPAAHLLILANGWIMEQ